MAYQNWKSRARKGCGFFLLWRLAGRRAPVSISMERGMDDLKYCGEGEIEQAVGFVSIDYVDGEPVAEIGVAHGQDRRLAEMLREIDEILENEAPAFMRMH